MALIQRFIKTVKEWIAPTSHILRVDHPPKTYLENLFDCDFTIWKGPIDGSGFEGKKEDQSFLRSLKEIDLSKICLETGLREGEEPIIGEERLCRFRAVDRVCLDALIFQAILENKKLIPEDWKQYRRIRFDGTVLRDPYGKRCVLALSWTQGRLYPQDHDPWNWHACHESLDSYGDTRDVSAVIDRSYLYECLGIEHPPTHTLNR